MCVRVHCEHHWYKCLWIAKFSAFAKSLFVTSELNVSEWLRQIQLPHANNHGTHHTHTHTQHMKRQLGKMSD